MSIVVGLKYKDGVMLAADRQITYGRYRKEGQITKIKKSLGSQTAIGVVGSLRDLNLVLTNIDDLMNQEAYLHKWDMDLNYVVNTIVPQIFNLLRQNCRLNEDNKVVWSDSEFIVVSPEHIYTIDEYGGVLEHPLYAVIGCGDDSVLGYLNTLNLTKNNLKTETQAYSILEKCIKLSCKDQLFIDDNMNTIKVYY